MSLKNDYIVISDLNQYYHVQGDSKKKVFQVLYNGYTKILLTISWVDSLTCIVVRSNLIFQKGGTETTAEKFHVQKSQNQGDSNDLSWFVTLLVHSPRGMHEVCASNVHCRLDTAECTLSNWRFQRSLIIGHVTWHVWETLGNTTVRLRADWARYQTARVQSKQLRSAVFGLWVVYVY